MNRRDLFRAAAAAVVARALPWKSPAPEPKPLLLTRYWHERENAPWGGEGGFLVPPSYMDQLIASLGVPAAMLPSEAPPDLDSNAAAFRRYLRGET